MQTFKTKNGVRLDFLNPVPFPDGSGADCPVSLLIPGRLSPYYFQSIQAARYFADYFVESASRKEKPVGAELLEDWLLVRDALAELSECKPEPVRSAFWVKVRQAIAEDEEGGCEVYPLEGIEVSKSFLDDAQDYLYAGLTNEGIDRLASIAEAQAEDYLELLRDFKKVCARVAGAPNYISHANLEDLLALLRRASALMEEEG